MDPFATAHQQQQHQQQQQHDKYYNPNNASNSNEPVFDIKSPEFSCDHFRMYDFKVKACPRTRAHDWTQCPFAHPGEKARRRDPRKYNYSAVPCPDYRKGTCKRGDSCEYAHGVFECWLHPTRYRTQMCTDGTKCNRLVCFFAHHQGELRCPSDMGSVSDHGSQTQQQEDKNVKEQLFSAALAHLLALQNQQQQFIPPGSPNQGAGGMLPYPAAHQTSQNAAQMNAILQHMQDIQQQLLLSSQHQQMAASPNGMSPGGMQHHMNGAPACVAYAQMSNKQVLQQQQHFLAEEPLAGHQQQQQQYVQSPVAKSPAQKIAGSVPYYPLSPSSPIDMHFPTDDSSSPASPEASEEYGAIARMASSLQELSFQAGFSPSRSSSNSSTTFTKDELNVPPMNNTPSAVVAAVAVGVDNGGVLKQKKVGKCGSLENLLSSLPRSLSDVGLADAAKSHMAIQS
mmetsp:Transcript_13307/g.25345  ORF Transcript_13307/g.25345 Transcript_13307/m.25345 type:complete len:454 (-) Transcript_13307:273-1634(-)